MEDGAGTALNGDSSPNGDARPPTANGTVNGVAPTHKRNHSGGILSRLSFLRSGSDAQSPTSPTKKSPPSPQKPFVEEVLHQRDMEPSMAAAMRQHQHKARKRKGSLRKNVLMTTGKMFDRRSSLEKHDLREPIKSPPPTDGHLEQNGSTNGTVNSERTEADYDAAASAAGTSHSWVLPPPSHLKLDTLAQANGALSPTHQDPQLLSPDSITSPISRYASTTSDDDAGLHLSLGASAADLTRRRSTLRNPIVASPARAAQSPPPHSSADTEYWGWIILISTWIVFVVGMGSCLGVWSWAWDVGETPYAPPELEDDATLPIVGYYPALIVCTGVMAWVWCLVAWVGMKYFRHARFDSGVEGVGDGG